MLSSEHRLVVFTPYGRRAGSSRVRVFEWIEHLGLAATVHVFTTENAAGFRQVMRQPIALWRRHRELATTEIAPDDIVLIHRELSPFSDGKAEERLLRAGSRGIVDLDDGLQWDWGHGGYSRRLRPKSPKLIRIVRAADLVIAGNDLIAEWASQYAQRVVVIPSCVEPSRYKEKADYSLNDPPLVGWIGSAATEKHLRSWEPQLLELHKQTGARLIVIGAETNNQSALSRVTDRIPWTEDAVYNMTSSWDLGIMPLPDSLMERAKCAYKLLQYGSAGVPVLGSPTGVNAEILNWSATKIGNEVPAAVISQLRASDSERRTNAATLRSQIVNHFSFESNQRKYLAALYGFDAK
jgi:glycosyltransferase involved in cell wall biosynthesis